MTLDEQLRAALAAEAEVRTASPPDVHSLISGGRRRRRRRTMARTGVVAAAVAVIGGAAYGVTLIDPANDGSNPGIVDRPSEATSAPSTSALQDGSAGPVEPGTHRIFVGLDAAGDRIEAQMTVSGPGWASGDSPVLRDGDHAAGVGLHRPDRVATGSGCTGDWQGRDAAQTVRGLARQLARLPMGTVLRPPTTTEAFGHDGLHLRLRIGDGCPVDEWYVVLHAALGERGISYGDVPTEVVIDFWIVDLDGTPVVVDLWRNIDSPQTLVDRATRARESISFVPGD
jgi:hypothetical protein